MLRTGQTFNAYTYAEQPGSRTADHLTVTVMVSHRRVDGVIRNGPRTADKWQVVARVNGDLVEWSQPSRSKGHRGSAPTERQATLLWSRAKGIERERRAAHVERERLSAIRQGEQYRARNAR